AIASLAQGKEVSVGLTITTMVLAVLSAIFMAFQKNGECAKTAETHRSTEFNYKDIIRKIEAAFGGNNISTETVKEIETSLRMVDGQAPLILPAVDNMIESQSTKWTV